MGIRRRLLSANDCINRRISDNHIDRFHLMRIVVFGASGRCGSEFVHLAVANGHDVSAVVRPTTAYQPPERVNVLRGDVLDAGFVARIVPGHDAVVSALGM